ncbi:hypothetical protein MKX03_031923 [Papaver bracteatum]|nr:hypothetical protein MKX03_031923 [Papaver bracteatum]
MVEARLLFEEIPDRTAVSWTVMISGYSKMGDVYWDTESWIHKHLKRMQLPMTVQLNTALVSPLAVALRLSSGRTIPLTKSPLKPQCARKQR